MKPISQNLLSPKGQTYVKQAPVVSFQLQGASSPMHDPFGGFFNKEKSPAGITSAQPHIAPTEANFANRRQSVMGFPVRRGSAHLFQEMPKPSYDRSVSALVIDNKHAAAMDPIPHTGVV